MEKQIEITAPEGYEVDKDKSTFYRIVFKKIEDKKPKWEDFGEVKGYFIDANTEVIDYHTPFSEEINRNTWPTKEEAEASLALSQLCQWRDKYNEGWKADWDVSDVHYCIGIENGVAICDFYYNHRSLSFKSKEIADKFLSDFKDLIMVAAPLL